MSSLSGCTTLDLPSAFFPSPSLASEVPLHLAFSSLLKSCHSPRPCSNVITFWKLSLFLGANGQCAGKSRNVPPVVKILKFFPAGWSIELPQLPKLVPLNSTFTMVAPASPLGPLGPQWSDAQNNRGPPGCCWTADWSEVKHTGSHPCLPTPAAPSGQSVLSCGSLKALHRGVGMEVPSSPLFIYYKVTEHKDCIFQSIFVSPRHPHSVFSRKYPQCTCVG